jgi:AcrR family transcriptional regulator
MARLAEAVGVSRQTIYTEVGTKADLAELMVLAEAAKFLAIVDAAFDAHAPDAVTALRVAAQGVLEFGADNALMRAVVTSAHGVQPDLLPLLTTRSAGLLMLANQLLTERLEACAAEPQLAKAASEVVVRLVLSNLMQPTMTAGQAADLLVTVISPALRNQTR